MSNSPTEVIERINDFLWGIPVLILIIGGGIYLSAKLRFAQIHIIRILKSTVSSLRSHEVSENGVTPFQSFSTALAATVGTGSVAGVGAALAAGGKGAVFWMWISAFIGMGISYCENRLGVKYGKQKGKCGAVSYLEKIGKGRTLAVIYAVFTVLASLGMGNMVQANAAVSAGKTGLGLSPYILAACVLLFTAFTIAGKCSAAKLCEKLVPLLALLFIGGSLAVIVINPIRSAQALKDIVLCAFSPKAFIGGGIGTVCMEGIRRGAFSHEAGLGSTVAVNSSCNVSNADNVCMEENPGIMGMAEVFIDTMVICTLTAVVIIISGVPLTADSAVKGYSHLLGSVGQGFISVSLMLFALATIAGWFFIGEKAWLYISGRHETLAYRIIFLICAYLGAVHNPSLVWGISDIFNGLMALPNMAGVLILSKEISPPVFENTKRSI